MSSESESIRPSSQHELLSEALRCELRESALTDPQIDQLGYRSVTADQAHLLTGHRHSGWVVPITSPSGKPFTTSRGVPFHRLKPAQPVQTRPGGKPARYLSPAGEGCRPYFSPLWPDWLKVGRDRDITEGEKKADSGCAHGFPTIGLSGVDGWRDRRSGDSSTLPELLEGNWLKGAVRIAWDSDITHKPEVLASSADLANVIAVAGGTPLITLLPPEVNGRKNGVDDFIARHGADAYRLLRTYARPAGDVVYDDGKPIGLKWTWDPEPSGPEATHTKAITAWTVLKDEVQVLPLGAYRWVGTHWQRQMEGKPLDCISQLLHTWMDHAHWRKRTGAAFTSVLSELATRLHSPTGETWDPPYLMAFSNGTLDTRANTFTPGHRRSDRLTRCLPYPYDSDATCPSWLAFLEEASGGDQHLIAVQRAGMRWTIEPKDGNEYPIEVMLDLEGTKGRGKGTALAGVVALCGGLNNIATIRSSTFSNQNALLKMLNKPASIDFDAGGFIRNSDVLNSVVSNEPVDMKALYLNVSQAPLNTVIWRAMNDRPGQASAGAEGSDRRGIVIPYDITPAKRDPDLKAKIRSEAAGIFQWVWQLSMDDAAYTLRHAGDSGRIRDAQVRAALERNLVLRFLYEHFFDQGCDEVESSALFETFYAWLEKAREVGKDQAKDMTHNRFGRELKKLVSTGLQKHPLVDRHGVAFEKTRTTGLKNPGRTAYRIPELDSWPIASFLTGCSPEDPLGPVVSVGGAEGSGSAPISQDPSASNPSPRPNPEPSEPSEPFKEESPIGILEGPPAPYRKVLDPKILQKVQKVQDQGCDWVSDLRNPEGPEPLAPESHQDHPDHLRPSPERIGNGSGMDPTWSNPSRERMEWISPLIERGEDETTHHLDQAGVIPDPAEPSMPAAEPAWLPDLDQLRRADPAAHAASLVLKLDPRGDLGLSGAKVKPWLDYLRSHDPAA